MEYRIYELTYPEHLQKNIAIEYGYRKEIVNCIFTVVDIDRISFSYSHESMESAMNEIDRFKEDLKGKEITILPVIKIPY